MTPASHRSCDLSPTFTNLSTVFRPFPGRLRLIWVYFDGQIIENVAEELDAPNEFYFDKATRVLRVKPNATMTWPPTQPVVPPPINIVTYMH